MSKVAAKVSLAAASAAAAAVAAYLVAPTVKRADTVALRRVDRAALDELAARARSAEIAGDGIDASGVAALDAVHPRFPATRFRRTPVRPQDLALLEPESDPRVVYDPFCYRRYGPWDDYAFADPTGSSELWHMRTNALGLRDDEDVRKTRPDLRIVVAGDSHTEGVCDNRDSFTNVLEALLAAERPGRVVEALNTGRGGYSFFEYLGVLERFLPFEPDVFVVGVYGGNDFRDVLLLERVFQGLPAESVLEQRGPQIERATKIASPALSQAFLSMLEFAVAPQSVELALQAARDVSTEIAATCLRNGVHPIFVYVPPLTDVGGAGHQREIDELRAALELQPNDLRILDRMADSYLAFLRELRVDVLDLRSAFRAAEQPTYWPHDWHIDVAAHRRIAQELVPLVDAARPADSTRRAPSSRTPEEWCARRSPGAPGIELITEANRIAVFQPLETRNQAARAEKPFEIARLSESEVRARLALDETVEHDPESWFRARAGLDVRVECAEHAGGGWRVRTNALGLRPPREPSARPALRAVCAGDARALGACGDDELWSARLEHELSQRHAGAAIECWSAFVNGATLQQQLGTFERLRPLAADLFVAAVEGDDDFLTTLLAARGEPAEAAAPGLPPALSTAAHFKLRPRDVPAAVRQALDVLLELDRRCKASASSLLVLYVPSALDVEASDLGPEWRDAIQRLELETADLRVTDRMATQLVGELAARGVAVLDLRRALREDPRPCYWRSRAGLNVAGHEVVARHALPDFERAALAHMR